LHQFHFPVQTVQPTSISNGGERAQEPSREGYNMAQVKALFYIPLRDNDGRDLTTEIEALRTELYVRFVGWTFFGYVKGTFQLADGTQALDESGAYVVILDETRLPELEQVLRDFKSKTLQEAIYLEVQRTVEIRFL
jgi:hypothetical protein